MDQEAIDRCPVWGYSAGGAMALAMAQASARVTAVVSGGWSPAERQSDAAVRRIDRLGRMPAGQRAFIDWYRRFNWLEELAVMAIPRLVYVGTDDGPRMRGPRGIPRTRSALIDAGVTLLEFDGLDHLTCMSDPAFSTYVGPAILDWLADVRVS
jgi:pimeloyl-ACP methyl ester carboxylesterase